MNIPMRLVIWMVVRSREGITVSQKCQCVWIAWEGASNKLACWYPCWYPCVCVCVCLNVLPHILDEIAHVVLDHMSPFFPRRHIMVDGASGLRSLWLWCFGWQLWNAPWSYGITLVDVVMAALRRCYYDFGGLCLYHLCGVYFINISVDVILYEPSPPSIH